MLCFCFLCKNIFGVPSTCKKMGRNKNRFSAAVFGAAVFFAQQKTKAVQKCLFAYILRSKMFSTAKNKGSAKMDLMQKCLFARSKSLDFVKNTKQRQCVHFPKENVQHVKCYKCIWCKNVFLQSNTTLVK